MARVTGLDPSLTSFGVAQLTAAGPVLLAARCKDRGHARLARLLDVAGNYSAGADLVVIEGLSFGARGNALLDLAGLHWLVRQRLWELGVPYAVVSPAQLKQYATGSAVADKIAVVLAAVRAFPDARVDGHDTADALWLAAMGAHRLGVPIHKTTVAQATVLNARHADKGRRGQPKINWPTLDRGETPCTSPS